MSRGLTPAIDVLRLLTPCLHRVTDEKTAANITNTIVWRPVLFEAWFYPLGASQEYVFLEGICEQ